jgi:hypothetical protein
MQLEATELRALAQQLERRGQTAERLSILGVRSPHREGHQPNP